VLRGMTKVSRETGLNRRTLYKSFGGDVMPNVAQASAEWSYRPGEALKVTITALSAVGIWRLSTARHRLSTASQMSQLAT